MNIREWFDFSGDSMPSSDVNNSIDDLLSLYSAALKQYFSVHDAEDFHVIQNLDTKKLNLDQTLFLEWLKEKGFPYLKELASTSFGSDANLSAKIQYDLYILQEEMDFEYPDDVQSSLISIVNDFPNYVAATTESYFEYEDSFKYEESFKYTFGNSAYAESSFFSSEDASKYISATTVGLTTKESIKNSHQYRAISLPDSYNPILAKSNYSYIIEEIENLISNDKKSDDKSGFFILCWRRLNGNVRIL
ncbi:MAG: hypothetical protein WBB47_13110 [Paenisporosarcina sp.]